MLFNCETNRLTSCTAPCHIVPMLTTCYITVKENLLEESSMPKQGRKPDRSTILAWIIIAIIVIAMLYFLIKAGLTIIRGFSHGIANGLLTLAAVVLLGIFYWFHEDIRNWWHHH